MVEYRALGNVGLEAGAAFQPVGGRLGLLLSVFLTRVNQPLSTDFLIESVWNGTQSANPRGSLQVAINRLRRIVEPDGNGQWQDLVSVGQGYSLVVEDNRYDARVFESDLRSARAYRAKGNNARARGTLERALSHWQGQAFGDYFDEPAVRGEASRLDELKRTAEDELVDVLLDLGDHHRLIPMIKRLVEAEPLRERRWGQLMLALFRSNRQAEALRAYQDLRHNLNEELGIEPSGDLQTLEEAILLQDVSLYLKPATLPASYRDTPLPRFPTAFVGREAELDQVRAALEKSRLLSLVGMGGIGKTRLAVRAAEGFCRRMAHGCVYADLSELVTGQPLEPVLIRQAASVPERSESTREMLIDILRPRETLIVLDNAESLLESVQSLVSDLMRRCPQVKILVTSRVSIGIPGEATFRVPPMDVPEENESRVSDSLRLLLARIDHSIASAESDPELSELCRVTGGLPLAIELAASMLDSMTAAELTERLRRDIEAWEHRPAASGARHSLASVVGWSVGQLSDEEMRTLEAISVFRGGATFEAVDYVACRGNDVDFETVQLHLRKLVHLGLIRFSSEGGGRYSMLEPVRQTIDQRLDPSAEKRLVTAHTEYFCHLAMEARLVFETIAADQERLHTALAREAANFGAMLKRGMEGSDATILTALPGLILFWYRKGGIAEGAGWTTRALERFHPIGDEHIETLLFSAHIAMWDGNPNLALDRLEHFDGRISEFGESPLLARSLHLRGNVLSWGLGRPEQGIPHFMRSMEIARAISYPAGLISLLSAAHSLVKVGRSDEARELLELVPELATLTSAATGVDGRVFADVGTDHVLGLVDLYEGSADSAEPKLRRSYETTMSLGLPTIAAHVLVPLGWAQLFTGHPDDASDVAVRARAMITHETGGFRIGEALCLLGGIALERNESEQASRWFALALGRASRAPETDLIIMALAGLAAVSHRQGDDVLSATYATYMRRLMDETRLRLPKPIVSRWRLEEIGVANEAEELDIKHVLTMTKVAGDLSWTQLL